ncbi:hypothetical protein POVWA2_097050 [Plasmodium ovale wallikeri]|uniref:Uncharacterized protein n=1 Tax=Plasmodium ovale wallikeri TaxID=864142 RepID=A0A1A9ATI4_PLAOA|nr:hypothetical protein POVWA1_019120 [Plasmodium ovale wallikeri]SBT59478.1 hypothetical protein POVWA2_097050 [Plasmodium ovale wallikeri]
MYTYKSRKVGDKSTCACSQTPAWRRGSAVCTSQVVVPCVKLKKRANGVASCMVKREKNSRAREIYK